MIAKLLRRISESCFPRRCEMSIFCFGLSHQRAAVDVRERFAIPESGLPKALARPKTMPGLTEGLIVS
jgi:glutamyl-tRNA reductase